MTAPRVERPPESRRAWPDPAPPGRARRRGSDSPRSTPTPRCELDHRNPFELLAATILSAQCTDARVNLVTPALFARYPTPEDLAAADPDEVEEIIRSTGFYRNKTQEPDRHGPARSSTGSTARCRAPWRDLVTVPGVGRKTANVVRSVALDLPGLPVDTHVLRLSRRLGLTDETDPVKVELVLNPMVPAAERGRFSLRLILHGRRVCAARTPRCGECVLADFCPSSRV